MSISVLFNGVTYSVPETGEESWGESLTSYLTAIASGCLQKTGGTFTLTADTNFGANYGLLSKYFSTRSSNPSTSGLMRLSVSDTIGWRNNASSANLLLAVNGSNQLTFDGTAIYPAGITALTGDVTATGPGSVAATLATVNSNVGSYAISTVTVNGKGLVTAASAASTSGSGAVVLVTGATLITPALGTPTALVGTNISGTGTSFTSGAVVANGVTLAMLAQVATQTFLGRTTASTGNVESLTATQATAILNAMVGDSGSGGTKGLVPAPSAGDSAAGKVLSAGGTWALPGTASPLTTKGDLYTYTSTNARHAVPSDYGSIVADSAQTDGWRNASYTQLDGKPGKNYIQYGDFENNATTGWTATGCATITNGLPVTVGSGAAAFSSSNGGRTKGANTSSPAIVSSGQLAGSYSLSLATTGAGTIGDGYISSAYTIDIADQAKVLSYKLYYKSVTGSPVMAGTSSNTYAVEIYDVVNNAWLGVAGCFNFVQSSGVGIAQGTFQTASNTTSIQIFIYSPVAPVGASSLYIDDVYVGPQVMAFGPAITDTAQNTTGITFTNFGTVSAVNAALTRIGDLLKVVGSFTSGTSVGSVGSINIPYSIDYTKQGSNALNRVGDFGILQNASLIGSNLDPNAIFTDGSTASSVFFATSGSGTGYTKANGSAVGNNQPCSFSFTVPIAGWSSNTSMSADTSTRVVAAYYKSNSSQSAGTATPYRFDSKVFDNTASVTTGAAWKFTVPVSGYYQINFNGYNSTGSVTTDLYKNGTISQVGTSTSNSNLTAGSWLVQLVAGDYIDLRPSGTVTQPNDGAMFITINLLTGPAVVAASESVNARYYASVSSISGSYGVVTYSTKDFDSHSAYSSGTYTCPVSGKYQVNCGLQLGGSLAAGANDQIGIFINAVQKTNTFNNVTATQASARGVTLSDIVSLNAGDALTIQAASAATSPTIGGSNLNNYFSISRVGN